MNSDIITYLREYKISTKGFFRSQNKDGIALFDLISSFIIIYLLDRFTNISFYLPGKRKKLLLYSLTIPLGIIFHYLAGVDSFLTRQLVSSEFNVYKILIIFIYFIILYSFY